MDSSKCNSIDDICRYVGSEITTVLKNLSDNQADKLCEIRIKAKLPVILIFTDSKQFITLSGRLTQIYSDNLLTLSIERIDEIFCAMCEYSVHSHTQSIVNGYISLPSGSRVGVYGTAVTQNGEITAVRNIHGMNIRISGEFAGCSREIIENCYCGGIGNTLICGSPSSGKTTILKALCRTLSDNFQLKIAVIDERYEMSSSYIGYSTDVLSDYPKARGIQIALRTLSPDVIVFDELGRVDEVMSVIESLNSGVKFITTIHCKNDSELYLKEQFRLLKKANAVDYCVFIGKNFKINNILRVNENENIGTGDNGSLLHYERTIHSIQV